jgi:uncharacterized protein (TIGR02588 family)
VTGNEFRRAGPAGPWWRIHPGCALGSCRLPRTSDDDEGVTRADWDKRRKYAEWTSLAISTAIVISLLVAVTFLSITDGDREASIAIRPIQERQWTADGVTYLPIEITNTGSVPATDVHVVISHGAAAPSEIRLDVLAGGSTIEAIIGSATMLDPGQLSILTTSYIPP